MQIVIEEVKNVEIDMNCKDSIELEAGTQIYKNDTFHNNLKNLDFESSGHTGFQPEMGALTNMEIEQLLNNQM